MEPLYVAPSSGSRLIAIVLALLSLITLSTGAVFLMLYPDERAPIPINVGVLLVTWGFIYVILPVRYEVWPDRIRIVFPVLLRWTVDFASIDSLRPARWWEAYGYYGVRFATNPRQALIVQRVRPGLFSRWNVVIAPADREAFLRVAGDALASYRHGA